MPVINDLWSSAATVRRRTAPLNYIPVNVPYPLPYTGGYRDRHSRYDLRCLRRYGGYLYDAPLVVLWANDDYESDAWGGTVDVWDL